jgi:hypothetical protein
MATGFQIKVKGQLDQSYTTWLGSFVVTHTPGGDTLLTGTAVDQATLYGVLARCRDLGMTVLAIYPFPQEEIMRWIQVEATQVFEAQPAAVYGVIADYRVSHPAILPKAFTELVVEQGGYGAGTVLHGAVQVWGRSYPFHQIVSEPEPGRVLQETDLETGQITQFIFEPLDGGRRTQLTIVSHFPPSPGLLGWLERWTKPAVVRRLYRQELAQLAAYLRNQQTAASTLAQQGI